MSTKVFQFKITLKYIKPHIWRRIQILEHSSFWDLHVSVQCAMGWTNSHLHRFEVLNSKGKQEDIGYKDEELESKDGSMIKVRDYISMKNNEMLYVYDFGDGWEHSVKLEDITEKQQNQKYPVCIAGARACPPEDVCGVGGYEWFLAAIADPLHKEHERLLTWVGGKFKSEHFDPKEVHFRKWQYQPLDL